jgi:hypothetical protein
MARKTAAEVAAEKTTDGPEIEGQVSVALAEEEVNVQLVEDEGGDGESQGTRAEAAARGDGKKAKTPEELEAENQNLKGALRQQRQRGRTLLTELDAERARAANQDREKAEAKRVADADKQLEGLDDEESLRSAAPKLGEFLNQRFIDPTFVKLRQGQLRLSERLARRDYADYDKVLQESGVEDAISVDADGKPGDPAMWKKIIRDSEDPAEDAYQLGLAILKQKNGGTEKGSGAADDDIDDLNDNSGDRAAGRREVTERVTKAASKFVGVRHLPAAPGRETKRLVTRADIDKMSDEEYARLPEHVRKAHLQG